MSKKIFSLFIAILVAHSISAQNSMTVPYGSFEQWSSHPGYSVNTGFMMLPVYNDFSTPTGWNHLSYPVNESISMGFTTINVNTDMPLIIANQESGVVPEGNNAVKLQTFMLSDIVNPTVYTLASGYLDTTLTNTVYPSILSTGEVNIEHFIPIMNSLISNMDSIEALLVSLLDLDVNYLITGGIPLGGFEPTSLTGYYKYHSAVSGDNGGVLILGTHYNNTLHKRDVVGGGVNISLTDCTEYTQFSVDYLSLHDYDANYDEVAPDSLIILLVSSASLNRQQGSYLCIDSVSLYHMGTPEPPDTCAGIVGLSAVPTIHEAVLNWTATGTVQGYELEYGPYGFAQGSGTLVSPSSNTCTLSELAANTQYDVWLRSVCNNDVYGNWMMVSFTTLPDTCASIVNLSSVPAIHETELNWNTTGTVQGFELEYGPSGFSQGSGTLVSPTSNSYALNELAANTQYDVWLRTVCDDDIYGDWVMFSFTTLPDTCSRITFIDIVSTDISFTSEGLVTGYMASWQSSFEPEAWEVEYGISGFESGSGISELVHSPFYSLEPLQTNTQYELRVRTICTETIYGEWVSLPFMTEASPVEINQSTGIQLNISPNPSHGMCVVNLSDIPNAELRLYTSEGRLLQTIISDGSSIALQLPSQGVFLLQVTYNGGTVTHKIVNK